MSPTSITLTLSTFFSLAPYLYFLYPSRHFKRGERPGGGKKKEGRKRGKKRRRRCAVASNFSLLLFLLSYPICRQEGRKKKRKNEKRPPFLFTPSSLSTFSLIFFHIRRYGRKGKKSREGEGKKKKREVKRPARRNPIVTINFTSAMSRCLNRPADRSGKKRKERRFIRKKGGGRGRKREKRLTCSNLSNYHTSTSTCSRSSSHSTGRKVRGKKKRKKGREGRKSRRENDGYMLSSSLQFSGRSCLYRRTDLFSKKGKIEGEEKRKKKRRGKEGEKEGKGRSGRNISSTSAFAQPLFGPTSLSRKGRGEGKTF